MDRLGFVVGDFTALDAEVVGTPDLVRCTWCFTSFPDRETVVAALRQIATIREQHGSALWIYDMARLRRAETMPALFDLLNPDADPRLRVDGLASEAAAWTVEELTESLAEAPLTGLTWCRDRLLGLHHAWWAPGREGHRRRPNGRHRRCLPRPGGRRTDSPKAWPGRPEPGAASGQRTVTSARIPSPLIPGLHAVV